MLRISPDKPLAPRRLELDTVAPGLWIDVKPASSAAYNAAKFRARDDLRAVRDNGTVLAVIGAEPSLLPDLKTQHGFAGMIDTLTATYLLIEVGLAWGGIGLVVLDDAGEPVPAPDGDEGAPMTTDLIAVAMLQVLRLPEQFLRQYLAPIQDRDAEKKTSPSSPGGTSKMDPDTADDAGTPTNPAPMANGDAAAGSAPT